MFKHNNSITANKGCTKMLPKRRTFAHPNVRRNKKNKKYNMKEYED